MAQHKFLKSAYNKLQDNYYVEFKEDNILEVSADKDLAPFAFVIVEPEYPDTLLLSLAIDFKEVIIVADICLALASIADTQMVEPFYVDTKDMSITWGTDAEESYFLESNDVNENELMKMEPPTNTKH